MNFDYFRYSSKGGREENQDFVTVKRLPDGIFCALADGLGGHCDGEVASRCAAETAAANILDLPDHSEAGFGDLECLRSGIEKANTRLLELQKERCSNMRSTIVSLLIRGEHACWANVGDSRLYYLRRGCIAEVTEDHSVAYAKYKAGEILRHQIGFDEDQPRLLRTLGSEDTVRPAMYDSNVPTEEGDGFLLCSDGFWEYIYDQEILVDFLKASCAREWAELLLLRVMERIGAKNDNISVITVIPKER